MKARLAEERRLMAEKIERKKAELAAAREEKKRLREEQEAAMISRLAVEVPKMPPKDEARLQMAARLEEDRRLLQRK